MVTIDEFREYKDALDVRIKHAVRDAQRQAKLKLEAESNEMKRMLCELIASGEKVSAIHDATGLARTTIYRYRDEYLALRGASSVEELSGEPEKSADRIESRTGFGGIFIRRNGSESVYYDPEDGVFLQVEDYDNKNLGPTVKAERPHWVTDAVLFESGAPQLARLDEELAEVIAEGYDFDLGDE